MDFRCIKQEGMFLKKEMNDTGNGFRPDDTVNPISRKHITRLLCIDSLFRAHYESTISTDFVFFIPEHIKKVVSMKISSIELPSTQHMFSSVNHSNTFKITVDGDTQTVTIPSGNYTMEEVVDYINTVLESANVTASYDYPSGRISFDYSSVNSNGSLSLDFVTEGAKYRQNCGWFLGFKQNTYDANITANPDSTYSGSVTADSIYGSNFDKYIFVDIDDYQRNFLTGAVISVTNRTSTGNSSYIGNTIMAKLPIAIDPNSIMFNNGSDQLFKTREYFGPVKLEKLRIRLLNRYGDVVNLNNEDYSISLEITEMY